MTRERRRVRRNSRTAAVRGGVAVLQDPTRNKGTAFTEKERDALGLRGLLPPVVLTQELQVERILTSLRRLPNDLERFISLAALHDRNEALFFRVLGDHPDEATSRRFLETILQNAAIMVQPLWRPVYILASAKVHGYQPHPARQMQLTKVWMDA